MIKMSAFSFSNGVALFQPCRLGLAGLTAAALLGWAGTSLATNPAASYWLGETDGTWTGSNWASNAAGNPTPSIPSTNSNVIFSATDAANQNTTLGTDFKIKTLTINDPVAVTIGGTNTLTLTGANSLTVNEGAGLLTIDADLKLTNSPVITVNNGDGAVLNGALKVGTLGLTKSGTGTLTINGDTNIKGDLLVENGQLELTGKSANIVNTYVGYSGTGRSLTVSGGGVVKSGSSVSIGVDVGADFNTLTVTGADSKLTTDGDLNVGFQGAGSTLTIEDGGTVHSSFTKIGGYTTSNQNFVAVSGADSKLKTDNTLIVGYDGSYNGVAVLDGAKMVNGSGMLGLNADSTNNAVTVSGTGSLWQNNDTLYIGNQGSFNAVQIFDGGSAVVTGTTIDAVIGYSGTSRYNQLIVSGTGSSFQTGATLYVGKAGVGNYLEVSDGATVTNKNGRLGADLGSDNNYVSVSGTGSLWQNNGTLRVGDKGSDNTIDIYNGGRGDLAGNTFIGYAASSSYNSVRVSGSASYLQTGALTVGMNGVNSRVTVDDGATLESTSIFLASGTGSSGELVIGDFGKRPTFAARDRRRFDSLPGTVLTNTITGGAGDSQVIFQHSGSAYTFAPVLTGRLSVVHGGTGQTILTGSNSYSGGTFINSGTLTTENISALGTGAVTLGEDRRARFPESSTPPTLKAVGALTIDSLSWSSGSIELDPNVAPVDVTHDFINRGGSNFVASNYLTLGQTYTLLQFGGTTSYAASDFTLSYHNPNVTYLAQFAVTGTDGPEPEGGEVLLKILGAVATGNGLQNSNPVGIPAFASFFVNGLVNTGSPTENNVINALTFAPGSLLNVFNELSVTDGNFTVNSGTGTIGGTGTVTTPGNFNKLGAGLLNLLADVLVHGDTNILGGLLSVNGTLTTDNLYVQLTTWLKGNGIVFGNVINGGTVAPGNSPGTLTISGNYTQTSSGALDIEIASTSLFDRLIVSGNASLAGTLNVIPYSGFKLQYGQQFQFLQAGSISGAFDSIVAPAGFRGRVLEKNDALTLLIAPKSYAQVAETQNQKNVAKALNSYIKATKGDRQAVSIALDLQSAGQYPAAFNAIAPTFYESMLNTTIELANGQNQILAQRMSAVRLGARGFTAVGMQAVLANDKDGKSVMEAKGAKDILQPSFDTKWGVWVEGNGIFAKVTNISAVPNYRYSSGGFTVGADYAWNEHFSTGLYTGYQGTYAKYGGNGSNGGSNEINSALFGVYATYAQDSFYSDAIIGGSYNGYTTRRPIQFSTIDRTATAKPNGGQFSTYLDAGYDWHVSHFTFGPVVAGQYTYAGIAPFTEQGAQSLDLSVSQQNANSLRTNIGGHVAYTWNVAPNITLIPEARVFWQHEFLENSRSIAASLDGGNGPSFNYQTANPGRDSVLATAGVSAQFGQRWNGNFYYTADFGNQSFVSHMINAGLEWKF